MGKNEKKKVILHNEPSKNKRRQRSRRYKDSNVKKNYRFSIDNNLISVSAGIWIYARRDWKRTREQTGGSIRATVGGLQLYGALITRIERKLGCGSSQDKLRHNRTALHRSHLYTKESYKNTSALHSRMEFVNLGNKKCACVPSGSLFR